MHIRLKLWQKSKHEICIGQALQETAPVRHHQSCAVKKASSLIVWTHCMLRQKVGGMGGELTTVSVEHRRSCPLAFSLHSGAFERPPMYRPNHFGSCASCSTVGQSGLENAAQMYYLTFHLRLLVRGQKAIGKWMMLSRCSAVVTLLQLLFKSFFSEYATTTIDGLTLWGHIRLHLVEM